MILVTKVQTQVNNLHQRRNTERVYGASAHSYDVEFKALYTLIMPVDTGVILDTRDHGRGHG